MGMSGDRLFNGRVLLEHAAEEIRAETSLDAAELGVAVAAAADVLAVLQDASRKLEVGPADVPDRAAMHAWSLRLLDRGMRPRRGVLRLLR